MKTVKAVKVAKAVINIHSQIKAVIAHEAIRSSTFFGIF